MTMVSYHRRRSASLDQSAYPLALILIMVWLVAVPAFCEAYLSSFMYTSSLLSRQHWHQHSISRQDRLLGSKTNIHGKESIEEYKYRDADFLERTKHWVVIVDDEEAIRIAVGDYLFDHGYQVTACADADALLEVCATPREDGELPLPSIIVSDIRMPGKDGLELLGLLRADERLSRVPVILLTAKSMTKDRIEGYKAGADAYLPKPFNPDELLSIIDSSIRRRQQMAGSRGTLVDLKAEMSNIKDILRKNGEKVVRSTDVFLTPAEREVLELLSKGYSNGEIAKEREVGVIGINRTISNLYLKTATRTRTELVRWAIQTGYVAAR